MGVGGKDEGPDVEAGARLGGHPVLIGLDQGLEGLEVYVLGHGGDAQFLGGADHAADILVRTEELDFALRGAVGLEALEDLLGVVEHHGAGLQLQGAVGDDAGVVPAHALGVVHEEHMVGEIGPEGDAVHRGLLLRGGGPGDGDVHGVLPP